MKAEVRRLEILTDRQKRVLRVWVEAGSNKEAAQRLGLSRKTVEYHLARMRVSLGIGPLVWLGIWAVKHGIVSIEL